SGGACGLRGSTATSSLRCGSTANSSSSGGGGGVAAASAGAGGAGVPASMAANGSSGGGGGGGTAASSNPGSGTASPSGAGFDRRGGGRKSIAVRPDDSPPSSPGRATAPGATGGSRSGRPDDEAGSGASPNPGSGTAPLAGDFPPIAGRDGVAFGAAGFAAGWGAAAFAALFGASPFGRCTVKGFLHFGHLMERPAGGTRESSSSYAAAQFGQEIFTRRRPEVTLASACCLANETAGLSWYRRVLMRRGGRAIVIGRGLAGLACAGELGSACALLEAEDRVGGLCRTEVIEGFSFDWTGHWLDARDPEMRD